MEVSRQATKGIDEIERQAGRIEEIMVNFKKSCNDIANEFGNIMRYMASHEGYDDSLSRTFSSYQDAFVDLMYRGSEKYLLLSQDMQNYVKNTRANAQAASESINRASSELNGTISDLQSLLR